jgi:hypothetical protein
MPAARPEFGPSLPELAASRLRLPEARVRAILLGAVAVAAVLYVASGLLGVRGTPALQDEIVGGAVPFTLGHSDALRRVDPQPGEALRLVGRPGAPEQSYAAEPFAIPPHRGDVTAVLGVLAARQADALARELADFRYRGDGKARINELPGHLLVFQFRRDGRTVYGKRFLLAPLAEPGAPAPRRGMAVTLLAERSPAVPNADAVGDDSALKAPLRSFRFGTDRP